jgi:hypothetical protein
MIQFRKRAELQSLRFLSWDEYNTKQLVQHYNLIQEIRAEQGDVLKQKSDLMKSLTEEKKALHGSKFLMDEMTH